jgi:type II secretory pathway component GspD/PulD (secretin)
MMLRKMTGHLSRRRLPARQEIVCCLLVWFLAYGFTSQAMTPESTLVAVDFDNVELRLFIKFVSEVTGRVFLLDDRVRGQVSVRFANKIPIDQLHDVLESVLEVKGFAVIPAGPITKIVPLGTAKQRGVAVTGSGPSVPSSGR